MISIINEVSRFFLYFLFAHSFPYPIQLSSFVYLRNFNILCAYSVGSFAFPFSKAVFICAVHITHCANFSDTIWAFDSQRTRNLCICSHFLGVRSSSSEINAFSGRRKVATTIRKINEGMESVHKRATKTELFIQKNENKTEKKMKKRFEQRVRDANYNAIFPPKRQQQQQVHRHVTNFNFFPLALSSTVTAAADGT